MKVLIIRFSSIGDIVLTTPVIRVLKTQMNAEVHYLTKSGYSSLLKDNPYIDRIHRFENSLSGIIEVLKAEQYDRVIDLHHNLRTFIIKNKLSRPSYSFYKANIPKWFFVNFKIDTLPPEHIVDRYLATLKNLGISNDGQGLDYFISTTENPGQKYRIKSKYIAVSLGANHYTKQIPYTVFRSVLENMDMSFILIGGKDVMELGNKLSQGLNHVSNFAGKTSFDESAELIKNCEVLLSGDTGMMHIGAALKKPIVSIWGNTTPRFGMYPYYGDLKIANRMHGINISCRPCSKTGYSKCPKKHFKCMNEQDPQEIIKSLLYLMA